MRHLAGRRAELLRDRDDPAVPRLLAHRVDERRVEHVHFVDARRPCTRRSATSRGRPAGRDAAGRPVARRSRPRWRPSAAGSPGPCRRSRRSRRRSPCPSSPCAACSTSRSTFVLSPPHRPLSVVTTMRRRASTCSRGTRNGCRYSVLAFATCSMMLNTFSTYGRVARIRSCAFFIFDAATISIALVIFRVLCTLLILFRISLDPAIVGSASATSFVVPA